VHVRLVYSVCVCVHACVTRRCTPAPPGDANRRPPSRPPPASAAAATRTMTTKTTRCVRVGWVVGWLGGCHRPRPRLPLGAQGYRARDCAPGGWWPICAVRRAPLLWRFGRALRTQSPRHGNAGSTRTCPMRGHTRTVSIPLAHLVAHTSQSGQPVWPPSPPHCCHHGVLVAAAVRRP
jgi:hypothetical protein